MPTISITISGRVADDIPRDAAARLNATMGQAIAVSTGIMRALAIGNIPKRTGRTAGTIEQLTVGIGSAHATGYVGSNDQIAMILELGSSPHIIQPAVKRALWWPGLAHPVAFARHPGTIPYLWLTRAGEFAGEIAKVRLAAAFRAAFG